MRALPRRLATLLVLTLASPGARAEGVGSSPPGGSSDRRLMAVTGMRPIEGGLLSVGGSALRFLANGSRRWETLHDVRKDNLYRVRSDEAGRVLATWENEDRIHFFPAGRKEHVTFPKPPRPPEVHHRWDVYDLQFLPNGRDALVFVRSQVAVKSPGLRGESWLAAAFRYALDGKTEPVQLFRIDHAFSLHTSNLGAVFAMSKHPGNRCDYGGCVISAIVALEFDGDGVRRTTLVDGNETPMTRARLVRGSDADRIALVLDVSKGLGLLRWRYGDAKAELRTLPLTSREDPGLILTRTGDFLEFRRSDEFRLEILRLDPRGDEPLASLKALQRVDTGLHDFGERADGSLWLHWGDHLGLVDRRGGGQPPRSYDLSRLLPRRAEWAGSDVYVGSPEQLWIGVETPGRCYERLDFAELEKGAKPWPAAPAVAGPANVPDPAVSAPAVDPAVAARAWTAKDPSSATRLYSASALHPYAGGLFTAGFKAFRRLPKGAKKWETLHVLPEDELYRAAGDDRGRLLAAWVKDPAIHLFDPAAGTHVVLPKPATPGKAKVGCQVDQLFFEPDGRDALVYTWCLHDLHGRGSSSAWRIALDGRSAPRLVFDVDDALLLHASLRGAVFVFPMDAKQECSQRTCHPVDAIVAWEFVGEKVESRVLLRGSDADVSSAMPVLGSDEERVAMVLDLEKRDGPRRLDGGRALLRWRWGADRTDYRALPGRSSLPPVWLLTKGGDFVELVDRNDGGTQFLEVNRYLPGSEVRTTKLEARQRGPRLRGVGERKDGGLWIAWGDRLVLLSPDRPPRGYDLDPLIERGKEWADAYVHVPEPEALWVGLDGRARDYVRVDLADVEKKAKEWR